MCCAPTLHHNGDEADPYEDKDADHWIFGLDLNRAWHELWGQQRGLNGKGNDGSNTMEFSFQTVRGKGKDRTHKVIIDSTRHLVVVTANAY